MQVVFGGAARTVSLVAAGVAVTIAVNDWQQRRASHQGMIGCVDIAVRNFLDAFESLGHNFHVGLYDRVAETTELLLILLQNNFIEMLAADVVVVQEGGHMEERTQKCISLHSQLQVRPVGRVSCDVKAWQDKQPNLPVDDFLPQMLRDACPGFFRRFITFPHESAAIGHAIQRVHMSERLGIAAQHHVHVSQVAVHTNTFRGNHQEVGRRCAFLFRPVFRVGAHMQNFFWPSMVIRSPVPPTQVVAEISNDGSQVLPGGDHPPAADGVQADSDCVVGEQ